MSAWSADREFDHPPILHAQRMSGLTGRTAAMAWYCEWSVWAVRVVETKGGRTKPLARQWRLWLGY